MRLPSGCGRSESRNVEGLIRSLDELKQAGRASNTLLSKTLQEQSFEQCLADPCIVRLMGDRDMVMF